MPTPLLNQFVTTLTAQAGEVPPVAAELVLRTLGQEPSSPATTAAWVSVLSSSQPVAAEMLEAALTWRQAPVRVQAWARPEIAESRVRAAILTEPSGPVRAAMALARHLPAEVVTQALTPMTKAIASQLLAPETTKQAYERIPAVVLAAAVRTQAPGPRPGTSGLTKVCQFAAHRTLAPVVAADAECLLMVRLRVLECASVAAETVLEVLEAAGAPDACKDPAHVQAAMGVLLRPEVSAAELEALAAHVTAHAAAYARADLLNRIEERRRQGSRTVAPATVVNEATSPQELVEAVDGFDDTDFTDRLVNAVVTSPVASLAVLDALCARTGRTRAEVVLGTIGHGRECPSFVWEDLQLALDLMERATFQVQRSASVAVVDQVAHRVAAGQLAPGVRSWVWLLEKAYGAPAGLADRIPMLVLAASKPASAAVAARALELLAAAEAAGPAGAAAVESQLLDADVTLGDLPVLVGGVLAGSLAEA